MRLASLPSLIGVGLLAGCAADRGPGPAAVASPPVAAEPCVSFSFPVYFANGAALEPQARAVLAEAAARLKGCAIESVVVLGLADATGQAGVNERVSRQRAGAVADALAAAGLPRPSFTLEAFGQAGAITPSGVPEPLRRRAEVVVRAGPPGQQP